MTKGERGRIDDLEKSQKELWKTSEATRLDVKEIKENHLVHIRSDIRWLKWAVPIGFAILAIAQRL